MGSVSHRQGRKAQSDVRGTNALLVLVFSQDLLTIKTKTDKIPRLILQDKGYGPEMRNLGKQINLVRVIS